MRSYLFTAKDKIRREAFHRWLVARAYSIPIIPIGKSEIHKYLTYRHYEVQKYLQCLSVPLEKGGEKKKLQQME